MKTCTSEDIQKAREHVYRQSHPTPLRAYPGSSELVGAGFTLSTRIIMRSALNTALHDDLGVTHHDRVNLTKIHELARVVECVRERAALTE